MASSVWTGYLTFGLISMPVRLFSGARGSRVSFNMLHRSDHARVKQQLVCSEDGEVLGRDEIVKGYEYEKGRFVVMAKDDFRTAALEKTKTIDILDFVDPDAIDARYFETPYYLTPGKGSERAYALLREAIRQSGRVGIAKVILRDVQHLAAIEAIGDALVLTMMRFATELVDASQFSFPKPADVRAKELDMALALVENLSSAWEPERYTDEYRDNLMRVIQAKIKGRKPRLKEEDRPQEAEVIDLMERLQKSLAASRGGARKTPDAKTRTKKKGRKAA